jgi:hypothetical protein
MKTSTPETIVFANRNVIPIPTVFLENTPLAVK